MDSPSGTEPGEVRLIDLLGTLSLAVDLGLGQPMGHVARSALVAAGIGERTNMPTDQRALLHHVAMMGWVGCIADSREAAAWFGDDIAYRAGVYDLDMAPLPFLGYLMRRAGTGQPWPTRTVRRAGVLLDGGRSVRRSLRTHCLVTSVVARRLGLPAEVGAALALIFARWDGKGLPAGVGGADIPLPVRAWQVADVVEVHHARGGESAVREVLTARRGTAFDPALADLVLDDVERALAPADVPEPWSAMMHCEPSLARPLTPHEVERSLEALADWVDLKSPWCTGHSRSVAGLASDAARHLGLPNDRVRFVRRAGLLHALGKAGVPNTLWDKPTPLTDVERERIRLHTYYTERMTSRTALAQCGTVAAMVHERLDGSGHHRGLSGAAIPLEARILAAADTFRAHTEARPHRPAGTPDEAGDHLIAEVDAGRLDARAVDAVLAVAGVRRPHAAAPAGLTPREVEVLGRIARGETNRQVARHLGISVKTVGNHVERIYAKAQVSTRAEAALFAMEHLLVD